LKRSYISWSPTFAGGLVAAAVFFVLERENLQRNGCPDGVRRNDLAYEQVSARLRKLQVSPELIPETGPASSFDIVLPLSTLHRRFACARLSTIPCRDHTPDVSATFTTVAFGDSSLRWFEISA
jgi:hypothetical protein